MKRVTWLIALLAAVLLCAAPVLADDGFYVIAGRVAVGTRITSLPYTITASGYYYLTGNLSYAGGNAITVNNDNVTIDLMGFSLIGPSNGSLLYSGIFMNGRKNVEVRNGTVSGWHLGVSEYSNGGSHHRMIGVRANGNTYGIYLHGTDHLIKGCIASQGIFGSGSGLVIGTGTIGGCTAMNFTIVDIYSGYGIFIGGGTASGNVLLNCTAGIYATGSATISHNQVSNCTTGINGAGGGSIIGNVVYSDTGTGIVPSTNVNNPNVLDQNNVSGAGAHYGLGSGKTVWGLNGG